jgi:broad specificity phosphatase PhoE
MTDPAARPHGGESLVAVCERIAAWLDGLAAAEVVAVTHAGVIKAAVVHALGAPIEAFWRVTVDPLSVTELVRRCATWELVRANATTRATV